MDSQKPESKSDEIDLGQLFSKLVGSIHAGWMNFMRFLATLRRVPIENKWSFTIIIAASVAIGIAFTSVVRKNFYESKMILSCDYLNKKLAENIVEKLDVLARERSKHGLAVTLGLPDSVVSKVIGFRIAPFMAETDVVDLEILKEQLRAAATNANKKVIDDVIERIEVENRHAYEITVRTLSPGVIKPLEDAIVNHFRKNPYIAKRIEINEKNLIELKTQLEDDISRLDSIKAGIYLSFKQMAAQSKGSNNVIFGDKAVADPVQIFAQGILIYEVYNEVSTDLFTRKDFELIDGFTQFSDPASAGLVTMIIYSLIIGVIVAYLDVGLRSFNKYLANLQ